MFSVLQSAFFYSVNGIKYLPISRMNFSIVDLSQRSERKSWALWIASFKAIQKLLSARGPSLHDDAGRWLKFCDWSTDLRTWWKNLGSWSLTSKKLFNTAIQYKQMSQQPPCDTFDCIDCIHKSSYSNLFKLFYFDINCFNKFIF